MNKLFIRQNLGLGDHIICNAIVRHYAKDNEVELGVYPHNLVSVKAMFSDLPNVTFKEGDDIELNVYTATTPHPVLRLGFGCRFFNSWKFDSEFYAQAGLPFEMRWNGFKHAPVEQINTPSYQYVFVHDDPERGMVIDRKHIRSGMDVVVASKNKLLPIGAYMELLQSASEIHCIDSSFALLADSIPTAGRKFLHRYCRPNGEHPVYRNRWEIIV
jgi:hypothetical protein